MSLPVGQDTPHPPTWLELELNLRSHDLPPREKTVMAGSWPQVNQGGGEGGGIPGVPNKGEGVAGRQRPGQKESRQPGG